MQEMTRTGDGHSTMPPVEDESAKDLVRELISESRHLLREQLHLAQLEVRELTEDGRRRLDEDVAIAKAELKEEGEKAVRAGGMVGIGGVLAHAGLYLALFAAVFGLSRVLPSWLSGLIVAAVVAMAGAILIKSGVDKIKRVRVVPRRTIEHLQEDRSWMKERARALRSSIRASA